MSKSKPKRTAGAPSMTKNESDAVYAELDQSHSHCLSLIATCTELGKDIRDTDLMKHVVDLGSLVTAAETVGDRLVSMKADLDAIRQRDLASRAKHVGPDNIMRILAIGQDYEGWMNRFGRGVSPAMDKAYALIDSARVKMNEITGSNA